ncbi:hypothetical protein K1719_019179 [Acacia pycnantha]|nr:hypothetical protein K1719_019179 [Acacia pycnantha]
MFKLRVRGNQLIVTAPMLFEVKMEYMTDTNVVVWVDPETQTWRLMARDGISEQDATNRINAQMPLDAKKNLAHTIIDNTSSVDALNEQFQGVFLEVSRPVTWTELRHACLAASIVIALGIVIVLGGAIALAIVVFWNITMN